MATTTATTTVRTTTPTTAPTTRTITTKGLEERRQAEIEDAKKGVILGRIKTPTVMVLGHQIGGRTLYPEWLKTDWTPMPRIEIDVPQVFLPFPKPKRIPHIGGHSTKELVNVPVIGTAQKAEGYVATIGAGKVVGVGLKAASKAAKPLTGAISRTRIGAKVLPKLPKAADKVFTGVVAVGTGYEAHKGYKRGGAKGAIRSGLEAGTSFAAFAAGIGGIKRPVAIKIKPKTSARVQMSGKSLVGDNKGTIALERINAQVRTTHPLGTKVSRIKGSGYIESEGMAKDLAHFKTTTRLKVGKKPRAMETVGVSSPESHETFKITPGDLRKEFTILRSTGTSSRGRLFKTGATQDTSFWGKSSPVKTRSGKDITIMERQPKSTLITGRGSGLRKSLKDEVEFDYNFALRERAFKVSEPGIRFRGKGGKLKQVQKTKQKTGLDTIAEDITKSAQKIHIEEIIKPSLKEGVGASLFLTGKAVIKTSSKAGLKQDLIFDQKPISDQRSAISVVPKQDTRPRQDTIPFSRQKQISKQIPEGLTKQAQKEFLEDEVLPKPDQYTPSAARTIPRVDPIGNPYLPLVSIAPIPATITPPTPPIFPFGLGGAKSGAWRSSRWWRRFYKKNPVLEVSKWLTGK